MTNYYVTPNQDGTWNARRENSTRASSVLDSQLKAEREAKDFAANSGGGEVRIQDRNRHFRDSDTVPPAKDPFPPRDKKY